VLEEVGQKDDESDEVFSALKYGDGEEQQHENPNDEFKTYRGAEELARVIIQAMKTNGPFDGMLGFSQGCAAFRLFMALC
jgi:Serine hydrolase (FSH1)